MTVKWWVGVAALVAGVGTVVGTFLSLLSNMSWLLDIVGNFRFQYLWIGALTLGALWWTRQRAAFAAVGIALLMNLMVVAPYWWSSIAPPADDTRLTILHLNTRAANPAKEEVVELVRAAEADVIFLAEVTPDLLGLLAAADLPYEQVAGTPESTRIGIVALARTSAVSGRLINLGKSEVPGVLLEAPLGNRTIEILGFHTSSPGEEKRSADRNDQLAGAAALVAARERPMALIGDFNATPWTGAFRELLDSGLIDGQRGRGVAGSWPAGWGPFQIPIDHLLHTPELTTTSFAFGPSAGSDHRSLLVAIALAGT